MMAWDKITVIVDGIAASIASVIACCGKTLQMPKNAMLMVHNPWGFAQGSAKVMRKAADMLDKYGDRIVSVYQDWTHESADKIKAWMDDETWMTGTEALAAKFATELVDQEVELQASTSQFDFAVFRKAPRQLTSQQPPKDNMNKEAIMAKLRKLGIAFDEAASLESLQALLEQTVKDINEKAADEKASCVHLVPERTLTRQQGQVLHSLAILTEDEHGISVSRTRNA